MKRTVAGLVLLHLAFFVLPSCHSKPIVTSGRNVRILVHDSEGNLDSAVSGIEVVRLNFRSSQTPFDVGSISKMLYLAHRYYLLDSKFNIIKAFDDKGAYLFDIGTIGVVDSAFIRVEDIAYNSYNQTLWVVCNNPSKVVEFSLDGRFIRVVHPGFFASGVSFAGPGEYFYYVNQNNSSQAEGQNLLFTVDEGRVLGKYFGFPPGDTAMIEYTGGLYTTGNRVYFNPPFTGRYFSLTGDSIDEAYTIQFGPDSLRQVHPRDYYPGRLFIETNKYLVFNTISPTLVKSVVYDKMSGRLYSSNNNRSILGFLSDCGVGTQTEDGIVFLKDLSLYKPSPGDDHNAMKVRYPDAYKEVFTTDSTARFSLVKMHLR